MRKLFIWAAFGLFGPGGVATAHTYDPVGSLDPPDNISSPIGISDDGRIVVGDRECMYGTGDCSDDYSWTEAGGLVQLDFDPESALDLEPNQSVSSVVARDLSGDGLFVAGGYRVTTTLSATKSTTTYEQGFRWSAETGFEALGLLDGDGAMEAFAISSDGQTVVGYSAERFENWAPFSGADGGKAVRWTPGTGLVELGVPEFALGSVATLVSSNGGAIAGQLTLTGDVNLAFRWTGTTGVVGLGDLPGGSVYSLARAMTPDGHVIVGGSSSTGSGSGYLEAFRWDAETGMEGLGILGTGRTSTATGVSADGSVVVGESDYTSAQGRTEAFRWTQEDGMVGLGFLPGGTRSRAYAVSADGGLIVGYSNRSSSPACPETELCTDDIFVWTEGTGMVGLREVLAGHGYDISEWSPPLSIESPAFLTPDGNTLVVATRQYGCFGEPWCYYGAYVLTFIVHFDRLPAQIDVAPWSTANELAPTSSGLIGVAVLGQNAATGDPVNFDATQVDPATLRFGPGEAPNVAPPFVEDFDADGNPDVGFAFETADSGIACEDTEAMLAGETYGGDGFSAADAIVTVECDTGGCHP